MDGSDIPSVVPARSDFPTDQLHVTIHGDSDVASLCLWDTPVEDLKARFTPFMFLARIKQWLELAAEKTLHQSEQGAEPVLIGTRIQAILPAGDLDPNNRYTAVANQGIGDRVIIRFAEGKIDESDGPKELLRFILIPIKTDLVSGRAVRSAPKTFKQLSELLSLYGCNLIERVTEFVTSMKGEKGVHTAVPVLLISFPKSPSTEEAADGQDDWAFAMSQTVSELGLALGAFGSHENFTVPIIGAATEIAELPDIYLDPMIVVRELDGGELTALSGMEGAETLKLFGVGLGALGSKVVEICVRGGFGVWRLLDKDVFLPHNAVRHILGDWAIGQSKARHVAGFLNQIVPGSRVQEAFFADISDKENLSPEVEVALIESDLIVDMSASVAVARDLALRSDAARCVSFFFNPGATDLVMLLEDAERKCSLVDIEASYYAALIQNNSLKAHLNDQDVGAIRYGNGCRDVTARISPDKVSLLAGLAVQALRTFRHSNPPKASIWRTQIDGGISAIDVPVDPYHGQRFGEWDIRWGSGVLEAMAKEREANLPNETGGILLGLVDFERRLIRVSSAIEAPPDSVKKPHYFERGKTGLEERLRAVGVITAGQLRYVGEWHSHPRGSRALPSSEDNFLFQTLAHLFRGTGEPHIMGIISDDELFWRIGLSDAVGEGNLRLPE